MSSRVLMLCFLAKALFAGTVIEQPHSSLLFRMKRYQWFLNKFSSLLGGVEIVTTFLGSFGGDTSKGIKMLTDRSWVRALKRPDYLKINNEQVDILCERHGDLLQKVTGIPEFLKDSQTYPEEFGSQATAAFSSWH